MPWTSVRGLITSGFALMVVIIAFVTAGGTVQTSHHQADLEKLEFHSNRAALIQNVETQASVAGLLLQQFVVYSAALRLGAHRSPLDFYHRVTIGVVGTAMPAFETRLSPDDRWAAGWVLFAIGSTDWLDGYLARRLGQVSTVGKVLDPVADRLLFFVGVGSIIIDGSVPLWFAVAVLVREVAVAVGTLSLAAMGATRIDVTWFGKAATFLLMGAFPAFLVGASDHDTADGFRALAWAVGVPGLVLAYWSALLYVPLGRKALAEGRAARGAQS